MKKILIFLGVLLLLTDLAFAGVGTVGTDLTNAVAATTGSWTNAFSSHGAFIFYVLATIELVVIFGMMALKGELDFGAIMANLIRLVLIFGFWMMLLGTFGVAWMKTIPQSFEQIASSASGVGISADNMFAKVGEVYNNLWDSLSFWDNPAESFMLVLVGLVALVALILLGVKILTNLVFATLSVYMSSLFFAFGAFSLTRQWAINSVVNVLRYSAKYMAVLLMAGLGVTLLNNAIASANADMNTANIFVVLIFAFILYSLAHGIENFIDGYFTGMGGGENTLGGSLAKTMALGAGIGAMGAAKDSLSQVQAAAAAAEIPQTPGSNNTSGVPGSSGGTGTADNGTEKKGNFVNSAKAGAKNTAAVTLGAIGGATTGMLKGAMGVSTHNAGAKTGTGVGKSINATSSAVKKITGGDKKDNTPGSPASSGSGSSYLSGVPGSSGGTGTADNGTEKKGNFVNSAKNDTGSKKDNTPASSIDSEIKQSTVDKNIKQK